MNRKFFEKNLKKVKERMSGTSEIISDKVNDIQYHATKCVKKNPLKTVGISLLAGIIINKLFHFRK